MYNDTHQFQIVLLLDKEKNKGIKNYSQASSQNICNNKISTGF